MNESNVIITVESKYKLTIAIPTFNRNEKVVRVVKSLIPQLTSECELIIVDNHSDVPVKQSLSESLSSDEMSQIKIYRNPFNIGMSGNFMRCFELALGDYIWLLGDDDLVKQDAITTIFKTLCQEELSLNDNLLCINYRVDKLHKRETTFVTNGSQEFYDKLDSLRLLIFISTTILNRKRLIKNAKLGYQFSQSLVPHIVMLLHSIQDNDQCVFSSNLIVDWDYGIDNWSLFHFLIGFPTFLDSLLDHKVRKNMGERVAEMFHPRDAIIEILQYKKSSYYYYNQVSSRFYIYASLKMRIIWFFLFITLFSPSHFLRLLEFYCKLRNAPFKSTDASFERI